MGTPVIVDAARTAIGRYGGALKDVRPDDLGAIVIRKLLERNPISPESIEDVYFGCANQAGEDNRNVARMCLLLAGLPVTVPGVTVNRLCGSGLEAVNQGANAIKAGQGSIYVAGGTESMTRAPLVMMKPGKAYQRGNQQLHDTTLGWRLVNDALAAVYPPISLGETAENVAEQYGISREVQDEFAWASQQKYARALAKGAFSEEIVPVEIKGRKGEVTVVDQDEHPRPETTMERLASLKPAFKQGGTVTAGNSSGLNDGAAALLLMEQETANRLGVKPRARIVASAVAGVDPSVMGIGPVPATHKALKRAGLTIDDIDLFELNEAFAAQAVASVQELNIDMDKVNVNGGAIALGHPLGCSGARILTTLLYEMERREARYGLAAMCIGVGQGIATIIERV
ncbi:thiolase family protein [Aneurinibacillus migulanus]|uniref:acetyl-CoA C-acyltransferase n=1 Tax=Aneurinibacillus migulanus TaxID=47500 RepID=A0A0D1WJK4_ANEMI|nr:thiolase family protein [Aneurinibacillus migulanus]KIV58795.1 beta-ketoadipyl CoA thiolase [Aneurinibacillus migulanus]KON96486.1 beta-ketoadipyl CoA thiolase [Aneurinibacillus migulanus]MED0892450.1 thiolase family protein [Aneurinibacillus migulanus]MED1615597.1 thiolase family protein [Aneurinibacillus migulanus]SDI18684.1 3-oxo-5,6-didehydrosuberyl-CoA/3-oxoadipyl-CoA thiolase [Aneurinibacillus migulanus]